VTAAGKGYVELIYQVPVRIKDVNETIASIDLGDADIELICPCIKLALLDAAGGLRELSRLHDLVGRGACESDKWWVIGIVRRHNQVITRIEAQLISSIDTTGVYHMGRLPVELRLPGRAGEDRAQPTSIARP
jgi:hypothetical protein